MNIVEQAAKALDQLHIDSYEADGNSIIYRPNNPDGFMIMLSPNGQGGYTVSYEGWHEEFEKEEEALRCFLFGLSKTCRLRVHARGKKAYKWAVEQYVNQNWHIDSITGLLFFPFWRRSVITYHSNGVIDWPVSDERKGVTDA